jgi:RimJ/RimL family protein N-acetyltransferase
VERFHLDDSLAGPRILLQRTEQLSSDVLSALALDVERARFLLYFPALAPSLDLAGLGAAFATELRTLREHFEEYAYEVRERAGGRFLGHASVHAIAWKHGCAELAYWIRSDAEGQGYVSETVRVLEGYLFMRGFHRVEIRCDVLNTASAKVAERCGYVREGTLREHMLRRDGSYRDSFVFGKLAREL